jgi:glycosyltransferase involved in cell wall biosynthesis
MTLSIIIPAYNEEATIRRSLERLLCSLEIHDIQLEIVIVNDASSDKTMEEISQFESQHRHITKVISHESNLGKGAAINTALDHISGHITVIHDADLEYHPKDIPTLIKPIVDNYADIVYGSRFRGDKPHRVLFFWHSWGNRFLTTISNACTNLNLTDMETCYKAFKTEHLKSLKLVEKRFGIEPEITAKIARIPQIRIFEVGIAYYGRTYEEGKKVNWMDGVRALYCIIKYGLFKK